MFSKTFFLEIARKKILKTFFLFGEHLRLCPWPREGLSLEELSLALATDFFVFLALASASSLVSSTPPLILIPTKNKSLE